jgi:uncharacterized membrane protein YhaH (DUF805 family)
MGIQQAVASCFSKYVGFEGRAPRSEYWWWVLFVVVVAVILGILGSVVLGADSGAGAVLAGLFILATVLPGLAVIIRRLHDTDHSGWWFFIQLVPAIGGLWLLYFMVIPGTQGPNRFGDGLH